MAEGDYGKVEGTVTIGAVPVVRNLVAISYAPFDIAGSDDGQGGLLQGRQVVGEATSAADGTYELQSLGFFDEVVVLAIENYGEVWKPNRSCVVGDRLRPTIGNETGYVYVVTIDGVSDPTEPTWWVNDGGNDTGTIGTATAQAIESWWSVAHAPITPTYVNGSAVVYPLEIDPYFDSVVSLVHFEDGGAATSVVDEIYVTDWTISGTAGISTVDFKFGGGSIEIDGVADGYIYLGDASLLPAGVFTMECHFMIDDLSIDRGLMYYGSVGQNNGRMQAYVQSSGGVVFHGNDSTGTAVWTAISATGLVAVGTWYHMAVVNDGVNAYIYLDGLNVAADTVSGPLTSAYQSLVLGLTRTGGTKRILDGKIDEFRYTANVARYTADFTAPAEAHPNSRFAVGREPTILDADFDKIELLLHGGETHLSTTIVDVKQHNVSNTVGDPAYSNVEFKFAETSIRMENDRIDYDSFSLGSTFTIETFYYLDSNATDQYIFENREGTDLDFAVYNRQVDSTVTFWAGGAVRLSAAAPTEAQWHHVALTYDGADFELWVNGVSAGTYNDPGLSFVDTNFAIGAYSGSSNYLAGYLEEFRVTKNAVRYTADFTVPAEAFPNFEYDPFESLATVVYPVVLDVHFDSNFSLVPGDGDLADVMGNTWLNLGTTISAVTSKWGAESVHFDGVSGFYRIFDDTWLDVSGAFTVETWVYPLKNTSHSPIWSLGDTNNSANRFILSLKDGGRIQAYAEDSSVRLSIVSVGLPVTLSAWHHIALCSDGTTVYIFVDGLLEASAAWSGQAFVPSENTLRWGVGWLGGAHSWYEGYMSDTRLTHGVCRYTEGFVAPTAALPITRFEVGKEPTILDANWMDNISVLNFEEMADGTSVTDTFPTNPYGSNVWTATGNAGVAAGVLQLDGTGDSITHTDILALRDAFNRNDPGHDFTIEIKYKAGSASAQQLIWGWQAGESNGLAVWQRDTDPTAIAFGVSDSGAGWDVFIATATATVAVGEDIEVAVTRNGDDYLMHVDGVYQGKGTFAGILNLGASGLGIGSASIIGDLLGDVYRFRSTLDVARYSESVNYTPDPGNSYIEYDPLEDLSLRTEVDPYFDSVVSLLHFDADLTTDVIAGNGWALKNTPVLATGQKYGSGCMDNSNVNGALRAVSGILIPPSGDWTIEMYFNPTAADLSGVHILVAQYTDAGAGRGSLRLNEGKLSMWSGSEGSLTEPTANTAGAWHHVAVVMSGGVLSLYKDGALVATADWSGYSPVQDETVIGAMIIDADTVSNPFGGKIDEFRATLLARYTTAFAVPTEAHPDSRYTYTE